MKIKNLFTGLLFLGIVTIVTGCADKPDMETRNGIDFAEAQNVPENAEDSKGSGQGDMDSSVIQTEVVTDAATIKIDAQITHRPSNDTGYTGIAEHKTIDMENLQSVLVHYGTDYQNIKSNEIQLSISEDGMLSYLNYELDRKYPNNTSKSVDSLGETDAPDTTLTRAEAMEETRDIVEQIGGPQIEILSCQAYKDSNGKGFYQTEFVPVFQDVPFTSGLPGFSDYSIEELFGRLLLTEDGIMELTGDFMIDYENMEKQMILSGDEIIEALRTHLQSGKMVTTPEVLVNRIQYEYLPKYVEGKIQVVPIWHLYVDESKAGNVDETEFCVQGIGINACDGEMEFAY